MTDADCTMWLMSYGSALQLYARQFVKSLADAEDVVQSAFLRASLRAEMPADPKTFLFACVRNAAIDHLRANQRRVRYEISVVSHKTQFVSSDCEGDEFRESLEVALANLAANYREVLVLKIWGGLTFQQIGDAIQISSNTAASRYRKAIVVLRRALATREALK